MYKNTYNDSKTTYTVHELFYLIKNAAAEPCARTEEVSLQASPSVAVTICLMRHQDEVVCCFA